MYCCMYSECGSEYTTKFNLKRHVESVHMRLKKFKCPTCGGLYSSRQSLKEHNYIHTGSVPFACLTCMKTFRQASQLSLHKRMHNVYGIKDNYVKNNGRREDHEFNPIKIDYEIVIKDYTLPKISEERTGCTLLPFPSLNFF